MTNSPLRPPNPLGGRFAPPHPPAPNPLGGYLGKPSPLRGSSLAPRRLRLLRKRFPARSLTNPVPDRDGSGVIARSLLQRNGNPSRFITLSLSGNSILVAVVYPVAEWSSHLVSSLRVVPPHRSAGLGSIPILLLPVMIDYLSDSFPVWS